MKNIHVFLKTHNKRFFYDFQVDPSASVTEVLLLTRIEVQKEEYDVKTELCSVHHVMTWRGRNLHQYAIRQMSTRMQQLESRSRRYFCDADVYLQIIEKYRVPNAKFIADCSATSLALARLAPKHDFKSPECEVESELSSMYPMPFLIPQQMIRRVYNAYLDAYNTDFCTRLVRIKGVIPIDQEPGKPKNPDMLCYEVIVRVPRLIVYLFYPFFYFYYLFTLLFEYGAAFLRLSTPYFEVSAVKMHRIQPVIALRFPIHPTLLRTCIQAAGFYLIQYIQSMIAKKLSQSGMLHWHQIVFALYACKILLSGTSLFMSFEFIIRHFRLVDALGNDNFRHHYIFDEACRADTGEYGRGGYQRSSQAPELFKLAKQLNQTYKPGILYCVALFFKSLNPLFDLK